MFSPIVELYEYQIHKYDPINMHVPSPYDGAPKQLFKFNNIDDTPKDECKRISVEGIPIPQNTDIDTNKSSCDPIFNIGGKLESHDIYDIDNIYGNYKLFLANDINTEQLDPRSIDKILNTITETIRIQISILEHNKLNKNENLDYLFSKIITNKIDILANNNNKLLTDFSDQTALIQKLVVNNNNKIILFGDLHGSFHTFFRSICRLHRYGVLNLETFTINDPYKIIFLGDILDRGMYSLDILNIIFKLINNNNTDFDNPKIIFNRGNHENYDQYYYGMLNGIHSQIAGNEFKKKFNNDVKLTKFFTLFNLLLCILPSAVIINNTDSNNNIWCSHGGFPRKYLTEQIDLTNKFILIRNKIDSMDIRWSDFGHPNPYVTHVDSSRGGTVIHYTYLGAISFLEKNNISFIIRGHQDSDDNSMLFGKDGTKILINNPININIANILIYNTNRYTDPNDLSKLSNRYKGPIARLILDIQAYTDIFPVLTISTNTDNGRYLNSDSFAVLKFNIEKKDIDNFEINILNILNPIRDVLNNKNINKGNIIENNLNTSLKILKSLNDDSFILLLKVCIDDTFIVHINKIIINISDVNLYNNIINIKSIFFDVLNIIEYYSKKINSMNTKIIEINKKQQYIIPNIFTELSTLLQKIIDEYNDFYKNYDAINEEYVTENIDKMIHNNEVSRILIQLNEYVKEYDANNL